MDDNLKTLIGSMMLAPVLTLAVMASVRSLKDVYGLRWLGFLAFCAVWIVLAVYLVAS